MTWIESDDRRRLTAKPTLADLTMNTTASGRRMDIGVGTAAQT
jgi:hypothetical protein